MANNLDNDMLSFQNDQLSLCKSIKEILGIIVRFHFNNEYNNRRTSNADWKLDLSIHVKKKSQVKKDELDVFTVKVNCNREVPIISSLQELKASKLIDFIQHMQKHEEESHFAVRIPDKYNTNSTRTFVLRVSQEDDTSVVQIQNETLSKRTEKTDEALVLQLRIFMNASALMSEVKSISSMLHSLKLLSPMVGICLSLDGIGGFHLDLRKCEYFLCESLMVSSHPKLYNCKTPYDGEICERDMSLLKAFHACIDSTPNSSPKVTCSLIFLPISIKDNARCEKRVSARKRGGIFIQVYDANRLPVDMLEFCIQCQITPDTLLPSHDFKSVMKIIGTSSIDPYNMECYVKTIKGTKLPHFVEECDRFTIWLCFVLDQDLSFSDSMSKEILGCLRESAKEAFQQLFYRETQEPSNNETSSIPTKNDHNDDAKNWITDITTTLSNIYVKSTDLSFRAHVAQMVPVNTCMSMKSYLQEKLETALLTEKGSNHAELLNAHKEECTVTNEDWEEFPMSQFSSNEGRIEGSMSPDSLDLQDNDWHDDMNNNLDNSITHQEEIIYMPVSQYCGIPLSQQKEISVHNEATDTSFYGCSNSSLQNISYDEIGCSNIVLYDPTAQAQPKVGCFKGRKQNSLPETLNYASNKEMTSLETELDQWKASGDIGHSTCSIDIAHCGLELDRKEDDLPLMTSYHQNNYRGSDCCETPLIKRSNLSASILNSKRMKVDIDLSISNCSEPNNDIKNSNSSMSSLMKLKEKSIEYHPKPRDTCDTGPQAMMNSGRCFDASIEQPVFQDFCRSEEVDDDWFSRDAFDNWCAELQD